MATVGRSPGPWPSNSAISSFVLPSSSSTTIEHALSCPRGGFPSIRHNEIRDITADVLTGVWTMSDSHGVGTEPCLQPVTGDRLALRSANREDGARLDIVAKNFRGRDRPHAFFM